MSSRQISESELDDSSHRDGQEAREMFAEISDESIAATDSAADTMEDVSSACTVQQPKPWSSSAQSSMAAFAQNFSATMSAGLLSLGYGKNDRTGESSHIKALTTIATDFNRGVIPPERITSLEALSASCVEVRTSMERPAGKRVNKCFTLLYMIYRYQLLVAGGNKRGGLG